MDVDEAEVEIEVTPAPEEQAHLALATQFNPFPFTHDTRNGIFARRSQMSDELVFDLLLEQASIASPQSLFPPDSPETLLDLLDAIAKCPWDTLKKSCLLFYLLSYVSPEIAAEHATLWALPAQFVHLAHACFLLDSGLPDGLAHAVSLLSDARIIQDLSSKILHTLSLASHPVSSRLIRTYVRTAQPVLEAYEDLAIYLRALLECSLADAWTFQRTFSESTPLRNQLFRTILDACLIPPKPSVLPHLLSLPLTTFEFSLLQTYALSPPEELTPAAHSILQDLLTVRLLHSGKYSDAIRLSRAFDTLNTKSHTGNTSALHKAAEDRQQMMRDVLAVVPEVQRRQLELEFIDERADGEATGLGTSWASMGNDVSMSWENLGASGSAETRERSRSGRLEGSPALKVSGKPSAPNTPFGLFSSPTGSAQKRKISAHAPANIFGTPTPGRSNPPVLPTIPTPGLDASMVAGTPSMLPGFRPPQLSLRDSLLRQPQNGTGPASTPRAGTGLNTRNAFVDLESPRAGTSLFGKSAQAKADSIFLTPRMRPTGGDGHAQGEKPSAPDKIPEDDRGEQVPTEDVMMVDSDDPDSFVLRRRRRTSFYPPLQTDQANTNVDADAGSSSVNGAHTNGTTLFGRREDTNPDPGRREASPQTRVLPGGFTSFELNEGGLAYPPAAPKVVTQEQPSRAASPPRAGRARSRRSGSTSDPQRLKIPGALYEYDEAEIEGGEEQDSVPSLPSVASKAGRRKRSSRASSTTESGDDDDGPKKSLRRSTRLSSAGLSPEPSSPQKQEKRARATSKRFSRTTGRSTRKRKNMDE